MSGAGTRSVWVAGLAVQFAAVTAAILVAVALVGWWEGRTDRARAEEALERLLAEIRRNREGLERELPAYEALISRLDTAIARLQADPESAPEVSVRYSMLYLEEAAWRTAIVRGDVPHLDPDLASSLAHIYDIHRLYADRGERIGLLTSSVEFFEPEAREGSLRAFRQALSSFVSVGRSLLELYEQTLRDVGGDRESVPANQETESQK